MPSFGDRRGSVQIILHTACQGSREGRGGRKILTRPTRQCQAQQSQGRGQGGETRLYKTAQKNEGWTDIDMYRIIFFSSLIIFVWKKTKTNSIGRFIFKQTCINRNVVCYFVDKLVQIYFLAICQSKKCRLREENNKVGARK